MSNKLELPSWDAFKEICITRKNLNCQFTEDSQRYDFYGPDSGDIMWHASIMKSDPRNSDQVDFEDNHKVNFNWAIGLRSYPFATGDAEFSGDGASDTCEAGQPKSIDFYPDGGGDRYINGGMLITEGAVFGDWLEAHVIHPQAGVVKTWVRKWFVPVSTSPLMIQTPYAGKLLSGLGLRATYHSVGMSPVKWAINYLLHKPI